MPRSAAAGQGRTRDPALWRFHSISKEIMKSIEISFKNVNLTKFTKVYKMSLGLELVHCRVIGFIFIRM
jgi:hypothetical protein